MTSFGSDANALYMRARVLALGARALVATNAAQQTYGKCCHIWWNIANQEHPNQNLTYDETVTLRKT